MFQEDAILYQGVIARAKSECIGKTEQLTVFLKKNLQKKKTTPHFADH